MNTFDRIRTATTIYKNGKLVGRGDISGSGWWVVPGCKARMENGDVIEIRVVIEIGGKEYTFVAEHIEKALRNATNAY